MRTFCRLCWGMGSNNIHCSTDIPPYDSSSVTTVATPPPITWWKPSTTGSTTPWWQSSTSSTSATTVPSWHSTTITAITTQPSSIPSTPAGKCQEGLYRRDPTDCRKYYRCVHGLEEPQTCAHGLQWDDAKVRDDEAIENLSIIIIIFDALFLSQEHPTSSHK